MTTNVFTRFRASKHTKLRVKLIIHNTREQLNKIADGDVWGYCVVYHPTDAKRTVAKIHMTKENFLVPVLAHEVFHAATAVKECSNLTGKTEYADEIIADTIENIMDECLRFAKLNKVPLILTEE